MKSPTMSAAWMVLAAMLAASLAGCGPTSVTFNFGPRDGQLHETTVISDGADRWNGPKVALIDLRGLIVDGPTPGLFQPGPNPVDDFVARLEKAQRDPDVKAVVIRVNSPGGSVSGSDTMYRELRRFREKTGKPVVISMAEVAASGGYYVSLGADRIVAQPTTITGSIGVIIPSINVSEGLKKIGIVSRSIKSGPNKDLANPLEPMRDSQYAILQGMVDEFYGRFRALVIERRGGSEAGTQSQSIGSPVRRTLDMSRIDQLTDGRIVSGADAVRAGLADQEGDLRDAFAVAKSLAGLESARLMMYHPEGEVPLSPYAAARGDVPPPQGAVNEISLVRVDLGGGGAGWLAGGNAYYVWVMGVP